MIPLFGTDRDRFRQRPCLQRRLFEEVDQMFEAGLHAWQLKDFQTTADKTALEGIERVERRKRQDWP